MPTIVSSHAFAIRRPANRYSFDIVTRCAVAAAPQELATIFAAGDALSSWWPAAFLRAETLAGHATAAGPVLRFHTKGLLPHTFQFVARVETADLPRLHRSRISGDFDGTTTITTEPVPGGMRLAFHWQVEVRKKGLRPLTPAIRWLLIANHLYAMRTGARGLDYEIRRRRAALSGTALPAGVCPPRPAFPHNLSLVRRLYRWHSGVAASTDRGRSGEQRHAPLAMR